MPDAHSKFSASNFEADSLCPGRRVMQQGLPDRGSKYADEGTAAHMLLEDMLNDTAKKIYTVNGKEWPVTEDMGAAVGTAFVNIRDIVGDGMLLSEQRVNYSEYLSVDADDAWGTSDVIAFRDTELQVHDYKHGMGVAVDAENNAQMKLYALGALAEYQGITGEFETVRLVIHQPRIKPAPSEWTTTVAELEAWGRGEAARSVQEQLYAETAAKTDEWERIYLRPNGKSCKFCKAKTACPALRVEALAPVFGEVPDSVEDFDDLTVPGKDHIKPSADAWLSAAMRKADMLEGWLKAVRAEVEARLLAGTPVAGFKIVQGKQGNRAWADPVEAEAEMKKMRLKVEEMYDLKLVSPTTAEKLAKAKTIGPRQWVALQEKITRAEGKPHVAPESDPRPALDVKSVADDFEPQGDIA